MASLLLASVPIHGHVAPMLEAARIFVARGDRVRCLTGARFAAAVRAVGADFIPLPPTADFDDRIDLHQRFPERAALGGAKAIAFDVVELFMRPARAQYDAMMQAQAQAAVDAVLADPAWAGAALLLGHARAARPAVVMCGVLPLALSSRDTAPFGLGLPPTTGMIGRLRNAMLARIAAPLMAPAQQLADRMHRELHGSILPGPILDWGRRADAIAQFTVPQFEYPRSDAPAHLHFVGPMPASGAPMPTPDWWPDLDNGCPVVHVTQGTIANKDFGQLIGPVFDALAHEPVLVVASTGGRPVAALPALPANARAAEYLPYDLLLPKTAVYVTNGGYGGVQHALRHGVPIVAIGGKEDKPEVGARIAWSGVGRRLRSAAPSPASLRSAVRDVLSDPRYRRNAARMAGHMRCPVGRPTLAEVVDAAIASAGHRSG